MKEIGKRLRNLREGIGVSQEKLNWIVFQETVMTVHGIKLS